MRRSGLAIQETIDSDRVSDATLVSNVVIHKPMPHGYGLPAGFDFAQYDQSENNFRKNTEKIALAWMLSVFIAVVLFCFIFGVWSLNLSSLGGFIGWLFICPFFTGPIGLAIYTFCGMERSRRARLGGYLNYKKNVATYRADLASWEFTNSERGLGYWQALRGVAFERAVALMFERRGCRVTTTKGSGDGGIDLVLYVGGQLFWGQCKGYAKPVSVAPIREMAGVCSRGQAVPILFAVNGFTKPALETAGELGVTCLDAPHLSKLARMEKISSAADILRAN